MFRLALLALLSLSLAACADSPGVAVGGDGQTPQPTPTPALPDAPEDPDDARSDEEPPGNQVSELPTGPIPVEPDGGIGDGAGPPGSAGVPPQQPLGTTMFGVSSETDAEPVEPFSYCLPDGAGPTLCADGLPDPQVTVTADSQLVVTFDVGEVAAQSSARLADPTDTPEQTPLPVTMENPGIWLVDVSGLDVGPHTAWLTWTDGAGLDAQAVVNLDIAR